MVDNEKVSAETKAYQKIPQILSFADENGVDYMKQEIESNYKRKNPTLCILLKAKWSVSKNDPNLQHLIQQE